LRRLEPIDRLAAIAALGSEEESITEGHRKADQPIHGSLSDGLPSLHEWRFAMFCFKVKSIGTDQGRPREPEAPLFIEAPCFYDARDFVSGRTGYSPTVCDLELVRDEKGAVQASAPPPLGLPIGSACYHITENRSAVGDRTRLVWKVTPRGVKKGRGV
jgi:hypothetical protein